MYPQMMHTYLSITSFVLDNVSNFRASLEISRLASLARNDRMGLLEVAGLEMTEGLEQGAEGFQETGRVARGVEFDVVA